GGLGAARAGRGRRRVLREHTRRRGRGRGVIRAAAATGEERAEHEQDRYAIGSGRSSENGSKVPSEPAVSVRCEKNRVITTPSRNAPTRGPGRSPLAIAIASSG